CASIYILNTINTCDPSNVSARNIRAAQNEVFAEKNVGWAAYGDYSMIKIHPEYDGPRPEHDDFVPHGGDFEKLDRKFEARLSHAFRCAMLLGGVDCMGWGGFTTTAHTDADIDRTAEAVSQTIDLLRADGLIA
ncbi:MAG: aspartate aminotransferase family protein, partial [Planctomycetaceae bacterium]